MISNDKRGGNGQPGPKAWYAGRRHMALGEKVNASWPRWELAVLLFLVLPSLLFSFGGVGSGVQFADIALALILRDLALLSLVLYFVWRGGEPFGAVGLTGAGAAREFTLGAALFIPFFLTGAFVGAVLRGLGAPGIKETPSFLVPHGIGQVVLAVFFLVVVAISEEVIFRGYLIRRFRQVSGSTGVALTVSTIVFALGHGYQGLAGLLTVGVIGALLGGVYVWRGSLIAPMVMHFLQDATGILILPHFQ